MNEMLREAFDQVQAENELKSKTKDFIFRKTKGYTRAKTVHYSRLIPALACMALLLTGGYRLCFTPTVEISIDINPSIELGVNRFNRVISLESYNDDGQELLLHSPDLKFMDYSEAVNRILESEEIASLLSDDELLSIAVVGTDSAQSEEILSHMQSCASGRSNAYCSFAHVEEVGDAHEAGLSYGKYQAFLELQALKPEITVSDVQNMTMREIRDLICALSEGEEHETEHSGDEHSENEHFENEHSENGHSEDGNEHGHGNENINGSPNGNGNRNGYGNGSGDGSGSSGGSGDGNGNGNGNGGGNGGENANTTANGNGSANANGRGNGNGSANGHHGGHGGQCREK